MEIESASGSVAYLELLNFIFSRGEPAAPRGQPTHELLDVQVIITDPEDVHVLKTSRRHSTSITATEAVHLIAGISSLQQLDDASGGRFHQFADGGRLRGAYGPRAYCQLERVVQSLSEDSDSRQAIVSIWNGTEMAASSRDVPCTLSLQFFIRDGKLRMRTSMRSNDVFLGLPIDWEVFAALQKTVAAVLGIPPGTYTHAIGSLHLYDHDRERAHAILEAGIIEPRRAPILREGALPDVTAMSPLQRWHGSRQAAEAVAMWQYHGEPEEEWRAWQHEVASRVPFLPERQPRWQVCSHCRYVTDGSCRECDTENLSE